MHVLFSCPWANARDWLDVLRATGPDLTFVPAAALERPEAIEAAVVWQPPRHLFENLPNLRCICALGAGVDYLFVPGMRLPKVPIVRIVDPVMAERMAGYVLAAVSYGHRQLGLYVRQQRERAWRKHMHKDTGEVRIGIMGLGAMGRASADLLARVGYSVAGWSRTEKPLASIDGYVGATGWQAFLARSDFLVCLLPLTPETRGILNAETFSALPPGAFVTNAGRGEHLIEADLLAALDHGQLSGAVLDVFAQEPLPAEHPFWSHPGILITPHVASLTNPETGAEQIVAALRAVRDGRQPANLVDPDRGY